MSDRLTRTEALRRSRVFEETTADLEEVDIDMLNTWCRARRGAFTYKDGPTAVWYTGPDFPPKRPMDIIHQLGLQDGPMWSR